MRWRRKRAIRGATNLSLPDGITTADRNGSSDARDASVNGCQGGGYSESGHPRRYEIRERLQQPKS